ncbi:RNA polymerase sigma factor [Chloroflexota bacterium]
MNHLSDRELIIRLQKGDLDALGQLYKRYRHMVYRTAYAITGDDDIANDLLHDIFLRLHRFASRIDCDRPLKPWLYRMTANQCYTWMKRKHRGLSLLKEIAERFLPGREQINPQEWAEEKDNWRQVQQALFNLSLNQRIVVVMHYLNDLSIQEIAETLNVPEGTVKSRLHYGRRSLQNNLQLQHLAQTDSLPGLRLGSP